MAAEKKKKFVLERGACGYSKIRYGRKVLLSLVEGAVVNERHAKAIVGAMNMLRTVIKRRKSWHDK